MESAHPGGRPTKYTPETVKKICDAITTGATYRLAAQYGGITYTTFNEWRKDNPEFSAAVEEAEGRGAMLLIGKIQKAATQSWRAAAWILERRHPEEYGRQIIDHGNKEGETFAVEVKVRDYREGLAPFLPPDDEVTE